MYELKETTYLDKFLTFSTAQACFRPVSGFATLRVCVKGDLSLILLDAQKYFIQLNKPRNCKTCASIIMCHNYT